jgi:hypothetical protein
MPKAVLLVFSKPSSPEREDEYNKWYDEVHLGEVTAIPGFTGAVRYKLSDQGLFPNEPDAFEYLAIYEMDSDDLNGTLQELTVRAGDGRMFMSDALSMDPMPAMQLYELRD